MKILRQPDDSTCGPTCLKMAANHFGLKSRMSIRSIARLCRTTKKYGTNPHQMEHGIQVLGLSYLKWKPGSIATLRSMPPSSLAILRVLDEGEKHWILCYGTEEGKFKIADPWSGDLRVSEEEIEKLWAPRKHFMFEVLNP